WTSSVAFLDRDQRWWFVGNRGLWEFPRTKSPDDINSLKPVRVITRVGEYDLRAAFRVYQDRRGSLWVSLRGFGPGQNGLLRIDRATGRFTPIGETQGLPPSHSAVCICEDSSGGIWFGFYQGGIARFFGDTLRFFAGGRTVPDGMITSIMFDRSGKLWIGSNQSGVTCIDNPFDENFHARTYTEKEGLSSNNVRCLLDDRWGRIYAGTARGVTQLDPNTGRVRYYTIRDGLPADFVTTAMRDRSNNLWFGTSDGVARLNPQPPASGSRELPVFFSGLEIAGVRYPLAPLGELSLPQIEFQPNETSLHIGFFSVGTNAGEVVRYQYRLRGTKDLWSPPSQDQSVHFENLSPGDYEFEVKAVSSTGNESLVPARFPFTILAPIPARWWFKALVAIFIFAAGYVAYRYKVSTLLRLERLRLRIASDLHDDVGSALTKISVYSEVIQSVSDLKKVHSVSRQIGDLSREVIRTFSDVVWSIDTKHDSYGELAARMKTFALDVLSPKDVRVEFSSSGIDPSESVPVEVRQNLYLIFKEAVNNVVRHSSAGSVEIALQKTDRELRLAIHDDGKGFPEGAVERGHGFRNMRARAALLHGTLDIRYQDGCTITLVVKAR
ncbi:MAG TPA: two-component regulator propeller domain-containing protein, partial [Bacteroidota bacterium]|nr:two-component regulator propeller domain-containing protein [Bacteroidota bacterium]